MYARNAISNGDQRSCRAWPVPSSCERRAGMEAAWGVERTKKCPQMRSISLCATRNLQSAPAEYSRYLHRSGRYAQALSVPHAELDERGEVVPHGRPMPSTPPLALSYAVKLSGSNRARFWYLLLPRGASTSTRRATRACALGGSPHSGLRDVCTYHSGKVTPILGTLPLRLHATRCQLRGQDDVPGCYRGRKRPLSYLHGCIQPGTIGLA